MYSSVVDPEIFIPDPDPTSKKFRIRIQVISLCCRVCGAVLWIRNYLFRIRDYLYLLRIRNYLFRIRFRHRKSFGFGSGSESGLGPYIAKYLKCKFFTKSFFFDVWSSIVAQKLVISFLYFLWLVSFFIQCIPDPVRQKFPDPTESGSTTLM